jgi:phosphoribosylformylglycinamidine synthase
MRNASQHYICKQIYLKAETIASPFTHNLRQHSVLRMPIGHMDGNYFCDDATLAELRSQDRIAFRYSNSMGEITPAANPNGSLENIAGILNEGRNVLGMMPHPDRSSESLLGSSDGLLLFQAMAESFAAA